MSWFKQEPKVVLEQWPTFAARYGGTQESCADAYLDGRMTAADRDDYEDKWLVANRVLGRLILRLRASGVLK